MTLQEAQSLTSLEQLPQDASYFSEGVTARVFDFNARFGHSFRHVYVNNIGFPRTNWLGHFADSIPAMPLQDNDITDVLTGLPLGFVPENTPNILTIVNRPGQSFGKPIEATYSLVEDEANRLESTWRFTYSYKAEFLGEPSPPSSTPLLGTEPSFDETLTATTLTLFRQSRDELFVDGFDSTFGEQLRLLVAAYSVPAVRAIERAIADPASSAEAAEETLRQMGYMTDESTHHARLGLLARALESTNVRLRDAASIGIASLDDPLAIPALHKAIAREPSAWLRETLEEVVNQLEDAP